MKKLFLESFLLLFTNLAFCQSDSISSSLVTNYIIEESNQFRVLTYLYRITNGTLPKEYQEFQNFCEDKNYPKSFPFIKNIRFHDTTKVSYDFELSTNDHIKIDDNNSLNSVLAHVTADYFSDLYSTIHSLQIDIKSAKLVTNNDMHSIKNVNNILMYIRLEESDILSIKTIITNDYEIDSPEYIITKSLEYTQNQQWDEISDLIYVEDCVLLKDALGNLLSQEDSQEFFEKIENVSNIEDFNNLAPKEIFPLFMNFLFSMQPQLAFAMQNINMKIIGSVREDENIHFLIRSTIQLMGKEYSQLSIETIIDVDGKYFLRLKDEMKETAEQWKNL